MDFFFSHSAGARLSSPNQRKEGGSVDITTCGASPGILGRPLPPSATNRREAFPGGKGREGSPGRLPNLALLGNRRGREKEAAWLRS